MDPTRTFVGPRRAPTSQHPAPAPGRQPPTARWGRHARDYVREFARQTSVHGCHHVAVFSRHPVEIVLWVLVMLASVVFSATLCASSWQRYNANPTVVSMQKDYRSWAMSFPAATICYLDRLNETAARQYIVKTWGNVSRSKYVSYMSFLNELTNISYGNLKRFKNFAKQPEFAKVDLLQAALELQLKMDHEMVHKSAKKVAQVGVWTEVGLCFTGQSAIAHHFDAKPGNPTFFESPDPYRRRAKAAFNHSAGLPQFIPHTLCDVESYCSTKYAHSKLYVYAVHSPFEMVNVNTPMLQPALHSMTDTNFKYLSSVASPSLRRLQPAQRRCSFADEGAEIGLPLYSYNLCRAVCRLRAVERLCGCIPIFYARMGSGKLCDLQGLACAGKHVKSVTGSACSCLPLCEDVYFTKDKELESLRRNSTTNTGGFSAGSYYNPTSVTWRVLFVTKFRLMRDVVFSFADLLVSFGGTAGLFLGCSLLSGVELIYFFTIRLFFHVCKILRQRR